MNKEIMFKNRIDAGRQLADKLSGYRSKNSVILALPRGGVPVGYEVASRLGAPLDTIVARKIGAPLNPEFGVGAIAPGDVIILDKVSIKTLGISEKSLEPAIKKEMEEMDRRMVHYKSGEYIKNIIADIVILVDDGLATGVTARAAIESVKITLKPNKIIFASPICSLDTALELRGLADEVVCLGEVRDLLSVGYWYQEFEQTSDEEVVDYLMRANNNK